ncbi:MAG: energy-coupled thiamine transporter ThiT, partial [Clostridia bacterium]|nr:energy-coupled thiamine transporter ThiT [Clostridia bacterium]
LVVLSYRHGTKWGLGAGMCYGMLQQLIALGTLSYVTTWQSVVAVILLDYVLAFAGCGLGGLFRHSVRKQAFSLGLGVLIACVFRFLCHLISGCTVWAGLSIPDEAALIYSFGYNITYMLPEAIVTFLAAIYLGSALDFSEKNPKPMIRKENSKKAYAFGAGAGLLVLGALVFDVVKIFPTLQNEDGVFDFVGIADVKWLPVLIVTAVCFALAACLTFFALKKNEEK